MNDIVIDTGQPVYKISSLYKGLVFDVPLTSTYLQSATVVSDRAPDHIHSTGVVGSPTFGTDGMTVDANEYATWTYSNFRANDTSGTISMWANIANVATHSVLFATAISSSSQDYMVVWSWATGEIAFNVRKSFDGNNNVTSSGAGLQNDTWYHIVITSDSTRYLLYINSVTQNKIEQTGSDDGRWFNFISSGRDNITVGTLVRNTGSTAPLTNGIISNVMVWDRELSSDEIVTLYKQGR